MKNKKKCGCLTSILRNTCPFDIIKFKKKKNNKHYYGILEHPAPHIHTPSQTHIIHTTH